MLKQQLKYKVAKLWAFISLLRISQILCQAICEGKIEVESYDFCPTIMQCPADMVKISLFSCALDQVFAVPIECKNDLSCWDGKCIQSSIEKKTKCPTGITCSTGNYKCPDYTCVNDTNKCPDYIDCPPFSPIRCPNGDCRKTLADCPSLVVCPYQIPMECNDGSCHLTKEKCSLAGNQTVCNYDPLKPTRCSDGTCASSKFLCPTPVTCPKGYVKCWDGNCNLIERCPVPDKSTSSTCGSESLVVCQFDYSCVKNIDFCPTGILCPVDTPVKCWDNSCRDTIENCPEYQVCPSGMKTCPDGSCGLGSCGTHITCSEKAPYRCFDNTCRRHPLDCPVQPSCSSETPILCWDGRCLAERGECLAPEQCEPSTPVKCPNGLCVKSNTFCKEEEDCPSEFVKCTDGTCRKKRMYCPEEKCPVNLPFKCKNGLCVSDSQYCENENGCPFYLPKKCPDGSCVNTTDICKNFTCPEGKQLCPDGSCLSKNSLCPRPNGCPQDTPLRCANGDCINPKKANCTIPICAPSTPYKCFDGSCVKTINFCPTEKKIAKSGRVLCADGREANSYDECKPLYACLEDEERCGDGTCRPGKDECPQANTCPGNQTRCKEGGCADNEGACPNDIGCPKSYPYKCNNTGFCVENDTDVCKNLESIFDASNGCPLEKPIRCKKTQKCVSNMDDCIPETGCPSDLPFMCEDGDCVKKKSECVGHGELCNKEKAPVECPVESEAKCRTSINECYTKQNCPFNQPFRCLKGDCHRFPIKYEKEDGCDMEISCPGYKPYLCADGSCTEKPDFCKSFISCPKDKPNLCFDRKCVANLNECSSTSHRKCPPQNPVLCPNSNCVTSIYDCIEMTCPYWVPYKCIRGVCTTRPRDCVKFIYNEEQAKYLESSVCEEDEYLCYDGTCRKDPKDCPIYLGCGSTSAPFKCFDGGCAANKNSCANKNNKDVYECEEGLTLCEDGLCRKNCEPVIYSGCPFSTPLLCPNGRCVTLSQECVGESSCVSADVPFRCIDGSCATEMKDCKSAFREFGTTNVTISVYPQTEVDADLIIGLDNILIGSILIPSDSIKDSKNVSTETQVYVKTVPRSVISNTYTTYNETRTDDLKAIYPFADPDNNLTLSYQYSILSSAVELTLKEPNRTNISDKVMFTLLYDFPFKHSLLKKSEESIYKSLDSAKRYTKMPLDYLKDVCLGKLNIKTRKWDCVPYEVEVKDLTNLELKGEVKESGIYAVILHLRINDNPLYIYDSWVINHLKELTYSALGVLIVIGILIYIFIRIYRYRVKYRTTRDEYKGFELELTDLKEKSVKGRQGQTLGDTKEGIIYTDNIAFKSNGDGDARRKNLQLEKLFDGFTKRLRTLERNNALLKTQLDNIKTEYDRLNDYKAQLMVNNDEGMQMNANVDANIGIGPSGVNASIGGSIN